MTHPDTSQLGLTLAYGGGLALVVMVFLQMGLLTILIAPFVWLVHRASAAGEGALAASHHRFLGRTWLLAAVIQLLVIALVVLAFGEVLTLGNIVLDAVAAADPGEEAWLAFDSLRAYLAHTHGLPLIKLVMALTLLGLSSAVIGLWLSVRLVRRWLRLSDGLPA